ncbi:MAG TPA: response regulator [Candidatus Hydrogenedentes bacterium]|nr:response regulator [Candidatus Hydrogenedentota bacterium]
MTAYFTRGFRPEWDTEPRKVTGDTADPVPILVVDDSETNRIVLERMSLAPGRVVHQAESGAEALKRAESCDYAVVLLDVQMPDMDGFETARRLRKIPGREHTPIIFVTAIDRTDAILFEGYAAGAVDFIFKPVSAPILRGKLTSFVDLYRSRRTVLRQLEQIRRQNEELRQQLEEIRTLQRLLPICVKCHKVRSDEGYWQTLEEYIRNMPDLMLSHCLCSECQKEVYPELSAQPQEPTASAPENS